MKKINELSRSLVSETISVRMAEFKRAGQSGPARIFSELCFCILTANYHAEGAIRIQTGTGRGFLGFPGPKLAAELRKQGYRFPNVRADYIVSARRFLPALMVQLKSKSDAQAREWLAENIYGIGLKEASHFLRNIGRSDVAIIDFHIIDLLVRAKMIEKPKSRALTKKRYLEIERLLAAVAEKCSLSLGELDLYLWYMETGKILK